MCSGLTDFGGGSLRNEVVTETELDAGAVVMRAEGLLVRSVCPEVEEYRGH
jgi:hypothetical protein